MSQNFLADPARSSAYSRLVQDVFGCRPVRSSAPDPRWTIFGLFETDGACAAGIEVGELSFVLDGTPASAMAIRLACVAPSHRGRGLFLDLMAAALGFCDAHPEGAPTLLYTEDEALYRRFDFAPLAQHAFVGAAPPGAILPAARPLDRQEAASAIRRLAPIREPVSRQCALRGASDLLLENLGDEDLRFAYVEALDALIVHETDDEELVVVDIVARAIPTMAEIVGALRSGQRPVRTLFPPDRLGWAATPLRDETGLMIRGRVPPAMRRPFMLPPTMSF